MPMRNDLDGVFLGRRAFLRNGVLTLTAAAIHSTKAATVDVEPLRIGLMTDLHYADKPASGTRYYRETPVKLAEAAARYQQDRPDFVVELGDFIDSAPDVDVEKGYLKTINHAFSSICEDRHYVLGNHCVDILTKDEFLEGVERPASYYSFDKGDFHFVVLDSCFRSDGVPYSRGNAHWTDANVPPAELEWLEADLQETRKHVVVFAHQRLDVSNDHGVKNNAQVRRILEASGRVLLVFQGHSHRNDFQEIHGVPYCTLVAMVDGSGEENNGYSLLSIQPNGSLELTGFRLQHSFHRG